MSGNYTGIEQSRAVKLCAAVLRVADIAALAILTLIFQHNIHLKYNFILSQIASFKSKLQVVINLMTYGE